MDISIPKLNIHITNDKLQQGALHVIRNIRPEWPENGLNFKNFTDGITNRLIGVYNGSNKGDMILIRVYGENTDLFIDRNIEYRNMRTMYKAGLSAPIYCSFSNGLAYGFSPGIVLDEQMVRDSNISALVAQNLARMHTLKPLVSQSDSNHSNGFTNQPRPNLFVGIRKFLSLLASALAAKGDVKRLNGFCDIQQFQAETIFLERELIKLESPIVFCHNDLLLKNIIYDQPCNKITFIDFEYSDYNYQAFDIANHFCEFCGIDDFDGSLYPDRPFQITWLKNYLRSWHSLNCNKLTSNVEDFQIELLYDKVDKFSLAAHFYWGLWALVQANNSSINFDYLTFAIKRLEEYFKRKSELFPIQSNHNQFRPQEKSCYA